MWVRLPPCDRLPQGQAGQQVAQGCRGDDPPPRQHLHEHHGDQGQALPGPQANRQTSLLSGVATIDNRNWLLYVTSNDPMGVTNQEFIHCAAPGRQPGPEEHDPRNDVLTCAIRAEERKHAKYDAICAAAGSILSPSALETTGGHGASTASVYLLFTKQARDSSLPADALVCKHHTPISLALRRGTIAQATSQALDGSLPLARRAVEAAELLALTGRAGGLVPRTPPLPPCSCHPPTRRHGPSPFPPSLPALSLLTNSLLTVVGGYLPWTSCCAAASLLDLLRCRGLLPSSAAASGRPSVAGTACWGESPRRATHRGATLQVRATRREALAKEERAECVGKQPARRPRPRPRRLRERERGRQAGARVSSAERQRGTARSGAQRSRWACGWPASRTCAATAQLGSRSVPRARSGTARPGPGVAACSLSLRWRRLQAQ